MKRQPWSTSDMKIGRVSGIESIMPSRNYSFARVSMKALFVSDITSSRVAASPNIASLLLSLYIKTAFLQPSIDYVPTTRLVQ